MTVKQLRETIDRWLSPSLATSFSTPAPPFAREDTVIILRIQITKRKTIRVPLVFHSVRVGQFSQANEIELWVDATEQIETAKHARGFYNGR